MDVSLTPELEQYIRDEVESGRFRSASEVVREGLSLLKRREELDRRKLERLRADIQVGLDQAERGQVSAFNEATLTEVRERGRERSNADRERDLP